MTVRRLTVLLVVSLAVLAALGAAYRLWMILPYPIGTGEARKSPDGRFEASVTDYYDEDFWGRPKRWFQFDVQGGRQPQRLITDPIPGPYFGSRSSHSVVFWAEDSSSVPFVFPAVEITMRPEAP